MSVQICQECVSEVVIRFEEQDCHCFETKVYEHAIGKELAVIFVGCRTTKVDYRCKHVNRLLNECCLLLLSCSLVIAARCGGELRLELRPDQEG